MERLDKGTLSNNLQRSVHQPVENLPSHEICQSVTFDSKTFVCPGCGSVGESFLIAPDRYHGRKQAFQLARCKSCTLVWLADPPPPGEIGKHYGPFYDRAIAAAGESSDDRWQKRKRTLSQYKNGGAILDLGCSSGSFISSLPKGNWDLYGIEMSAESAARAQRLCGAKIFVGDILDADFAPSSFDVITCFHVFEHLYHPKAVLEKVCEWLKPGGIFYVLVPNIDSAGARIFGTYWYALELPRHLYHFSPKSLSRLAEAAGLEVTSLETHRELFFEYSTRYLFDRLLQQCGFQRVSLAEAPAPGIPFRMVRKMFRLSVLPVITAIAAFAGDGESIHAVFRKDDPVKAPSAA